VAGRQRPPGRFESGCGHARRGHEVDVERQTRTDVEQPVHTVRAEHVGDLVRIGDHRRGAEWQHEARELVHEQLRRLEMHVRVDEAGDDIAAGRIENLGPVVLAEAGDVAVADRYVDVEPLAGEPGPGATAAEDAVGRLVAASYGNATREAIHRASLARPATASLA